MMASEQDVKTEQIPKRKREKSTLDNFRNLTNNQEKVRIKSGVHILKQLADTENQSEDELKYVLGRIVRGLGSSKLQAKSGFFSALVALLNLKEVAVDEIFQLVSKELHKGGSNSKSENSDICCGQVLVAGAVLRSQLYTNSEDEVKSKVLQLLMDAGKERTYLNLVSYQFLCDLFHKIQSDEFQRVIFPLIKNEISKNWREQNLNSLYLLTEIQTNFPQSLHEKFLRNNLGTSEVLCPESLHHVCNILTDIPGVVAVNHPIFDIFIKKVSESELIEQFFEELDHTLARFNRNRYFVFTKLLTGVLSNLTDSTVIPHILTKNYIQHTLSVYKTAVGKQKDKEFKTLTQKLFETLRNALQKEDVKSKTKIKVLKKLLFYPGTFVFEKVTKSKLIQNITFTLNTDGIKKLAAIYRDIIAGTVDKVINENLTERWWNIDRVYASHLLVKLINHPSLHDENDWKVEQIIFLGRISLLKDETDNIGGELADSLKETFYSALDLKLAKLDDLRHILSGVFHSFDEIAVTENALRFPLTENVIDTWKRTSHLATKLKSKTKKKHVVFHTLFLNLGLQLFDNSKVALDSLTELFDCYERTKKSNTDPDNTSNDPLWIEVVVDVFLNLLSHNSHLLRSVINCVFPHLCKYLNPTAVHQILSVLDPNNDSNPLSKYEESENSEDDDDDDDDSADEELDTESEQSSDEEEEEEDDMNEDDNKEDNANDKLRSALHQVLGAGTESDAESVDLDELDDEEGEKLNESLGKAFKQFKPNLGKSKKQKKDDETLTHFRIRVLDLIEIYINSNPSMFLTLEIMIPLLNLLEFCIKDDHQRPLQHRVNACLKKLTSLKKFSDFEDVTEEVLVDLLRSLLEKGSRISSVINEISDKIADCSILVITCSQILNNQEETKSSKRKQKHIINVIKESIEAFFTKRDCIISYGFFKSLLQLNWEGIVTLVPFLKGFAFAPTVRPFRRTQALELLQIFYHNQRFINAHLEEIKVVEEDTINFLRDCVDFLREFSENSTQLKVKEKYLCNLFQLLSVIKTSILGTKFEDWALLGEVVRDCRSRLSFSRDTKVAFNKLCKNLSISNIVEMKQKIVTLNNEEDNEDKSENVQAKESEKKEKKKKRKHLGKDKLILKKQSKELRLHSLSEGMSSKRKFTIDETEGSKKQKLLDM